jgi:hypothetical protein
VVSPQDNFSISHKKPFYSSFAVQYLHCTAVERIEINSFGSTNELK